MDQPTPIAMNQLRTRLSSLLDVLESGLVERRQVVRLCLLAALAGEHTLLIGPPGTAGSAAADGSSQLSSYSLQQRFNAVFLQCMYLRGNQIPGAATYRPQAPATVAPPPPPPNYAPPAGYQPPVYPPNTYQPPPSYPPPNYRPPNYRAPN